MRIVPVPCLSDNYAYLVFAGEARVAVVVDPSEAPPIEAALAREGATLGAILLTHHHFDHIGGAAELAASRDGLPVYAYEGDRARVPAMNHPLADGARFATCGLSVRALHVPGHTTGALAFVLDEAGRDVAAFTGDTLFVAGCGRLFEGTPAMMHRSLVATLGALAGDVRVYPGHEYTQSNLRFAAHVEPDNAAIAKKAASVAELRARGEPTVPSTIADELATTPFLRSASPGVRRFAALSPDASDVDVLAKVRAAKDAFS